MELHFTEQHKTRGIVQLRRAFGQTACLHSIGCDSFARTVSHRRIGCSTPMAALRRFFPPFERLGAILLRALRTKVALAQIVGRLRGIICRGFEVSDSNGRIALDHRATKVSEANEVHRIRIARIRCLVGPLHGLLIVFGHALAIAIPKGEFEFRFDIATNGTALYFREIVSRQSGIAHQ